MGADEAFEVSLADGGQGGGELMAFGGETIAVAFGDFSDEAMSAQDAELAADAGGEFLDVGRGCVEVGVEQAAQVAVAKACGGEFATGDGLEQGDVVGLADPQCSGTRRSWGR